MKDFKKDYYKILEIETFASVDEVKLAYRRQVKKHHPDLHPNNPDYGDLIKEINEAYEILSNKDERYAYDQFLLNKKAKQKTESTSTNPSSKNRRSYTKTTTIKNEERTYLKGEIFIKYYGKHEEREDENILREIFYKLKITQTDVVINQVHKLIPSEEFEKAFTENKPLHLDIKQPVSCRIIDKNNVLKSYKLHLYDLTVPVTRIINVTKHESESFGTIAGTFYAYVKEIKVHEDHRIVEECSGETGEKEKKFENGINYYREEYYNSDCSKFWGNWIADEIKETPKPTGRTQQSGNYSRYETYYASSKKMGWSRWKYTHNNKSQGNGCLASFGNIFVIAFILLLFIFLLPKFIFLLPFILIPILLSLIPSRIWYQLLRVIGLLYLLFFLSAISLLIFGTKYKKEKKVVTKPTTTIENPKYTPVTNPEESEKIIDTIITHNLDWEDYNGNKYNGNFSVTKSAFNQAHFYKENLNISSISDNNYDKIIFLLKEHDKSKLSGLYLMFDSIKLANKTNPKIFAELIVSFVQRIPYTIVLPDECDPQRYQDKFTARYLSNADARCDGYEKYGINTPVEFMANLNGDCDTRTLLLYTVLSHYNYDVALLSSAHYGHSIIGINLPYEGIAFNYGTQRYFFWETTAPNLKPGILSEEISNTDYWRISLKSK